MSKTLRIATIVMLLTIPSVLAQQSAASHVTDDMLAMDAKKYPEFSSGLTIEEFIAKGSHYDPINDAYAVAYHPNEGNRMAGTRRRDALLDIRELTYNSEVVVLATPLLRRSALIASHQFIFSDYEVRIDAVFVDYRRVLAGTSTVVVSRAGGEIVLNGKKVQAIETEFPLFSLGEQYLFFMIRLPSGSYLVEPWSAFLVSRGSIKEARNHPKRESIPYPMSRIEQEISLAAAENPRRF
jgi:hypothetical protein